MRSRRALLAVAAACLAALCVLAVNAYGHKNDTAIEFALGADPGCAEIGASGVTVHLTGQAVRSETFTLALRPVYPIGGAVIPLGSISSSASGKIDTTFTVPSQDAAVIFRIEAQGGGEYGIGYVSVPCPTLTVTPNCGPAYDPGNPTARYAVTVSGTGWGPYTRSQSILPVHVGVGSDFPGSPVTPNADGTFSVLMTPTRSPAGSSQILAFSQTKDEKDYDPNSAPNIRQRTAYATFVAPCPTTTNTNTTPTTATTAPTTATTTAPTTTTTATTTPATTQQSSTAAPPTHSKTTTTAPQITKTTKTTKTTTTQTGTLTLAIAPACLAVGGASSRVHVTGGGFAAGAVQVLLDGNVATNASADGDGKVSAEAEVTPGRTDHTIEIREGSRQVHATLRVPCTTHPHLDIDPELGPPGSVQTATGTGFPPNTMVVLTWNPGLGRWTVRTNGKGRFVTQVLILPSDQEGDRVLQAAPQQRRAFVRVQARFLAVPGTVQTPRTYEFRR